MPSVDSAGNAPIRSYEPPRAYRLRIRSVSWGREMTGQNSIRDHGNSHLRRGQELATPAEGELLQRPSKLQQRQKRRRMNLTTLHGTAREHARLIRQFINGDVSATTFELMSRALRRHMDINVAVEQGKAIEEIQQRLAALQSPTSVPKLPAPAAPQAAAPLPAWAVEPCATSEPVGANSGLPTNTLCQETES